MLGLPGALFLSGVSEGWIAVGLVIGAWCNWKYVAAPLRVYTERTRNALTLPDYFTHRFEDSSRILRVLSALVILVFFAVYAASGIVAGARLFEAVFEVPYAQALWVGAAATIIYTLVGGFLAVSWTDTVQATLMIFALVLTPIVVVLSMGGPAASLVLIEQANPANLDFFRGASTIGIISLMAWGLGYFGQPHILARFMAADSVESIPAARRIGMTWMVLCLAGAMAVGFFGIAWFQAHPDKAAMVTANPERVFISLSQLLFNPWIAGVLLSAILAAIMSTLSCQLLVCSSALTEDFYKGFFRKDAGPVRTGLGRPADRAAGVAACDLAGVGSRQSRARAGQLCLGRIRRGIRAGRAVLAGLEANDPQRRAGRHGGGRGDGDHLEAGRLVRAV